MAGVPETLRTGSCLPQHVNLPCMQEGKWKGIVEGDLGGRSGGTGRTPGICGPLWALRPPRAWHR
jgi:hypothetical protein